MVAPASSPLRVSLSDRRALAWPFRVILRRKVHEFASKVAGKSYSGAGLIGSDAASVRDGFASLSSTQFDEYNLAQVWVERRQVPLVLDGRVPAEHARVLDLGCGPGTSTALLAYFATPTWRITGYDVTPEFIALARARADRGDYRTKAGLTITPEFVCQSIDRLLCDATGSPIEPASVDLALSGGVVGLYLGKASIRRLAREMWRVLRPGGVVALDVGPAVGSRMLREALHDAAARSGGRFIEEPSARSFIIEPRPKRVFRKYS